MDYQILQGIRLRIQPVHHELPQLLISTCQAEEGLKTYPAQASTFLSAMKTDKNVPQILDMDGDTTESPTVTSYNPKGIPKIPRFDTQSDDINMGKVYGVLAYHQHPYGLLTAMNESIRPLAVNVWVPIEMTSLALRKSPWTSGDRTPKYVGNWDRNFLGLLQCRWPRSHPPPTWHALRAQRVDYSDISVPDS